jgi:hypothetical protein
MPASLKPIDACIVTKAGPRFPFANSILFPLRGVAMTFLTHSSRTRAAVLSARAKPSVALPNAAYPLDFNGEQAPNPDWLTLSRVLGELRRAVESLRLRNYRI